MTAEERAASLLTDGCPHDDHGDVFFAKIHCKECITLAIKDAVEEEREYWHSLIKDEANRMGYDSRGLTGPALIRDMPEQEREACARVAGDESWCSDRDYLDHHDECHYTTATNYNIWNNQRIHILRAPSKNPNKNKRNLSIVAPNGP